MARPQFLFIPFWAVLLVCIACLSVFSGTGVNAAFIDAMKHDIGQVNQATWAGKVDKFRSTEVFVILFYKKTSKESKHLVDGPFNDLAKKLKGQVGVLAVDCDESPKLCKDNAIDEYPTIVIFPTFPMPSMKYQGKKEVVDITKAVFPLIPSQIKSLATSAEVDSFIHGMVQVPKVLVFSDKSSVPPVLIKSLSNTFKDKLLFAYLPKANFADVATRMKVSKFPHIVVVRKGKKDEVYKGEFAFAKLFDWLNVFSETFVMGGGFSDDAPGQSDVDTKPWRSEPIPELTKMSNMDLCFKKSNKHLCVVYAKNGDQLTPDELAMLESFKIDYEDSSHNKGPEFRFMWMNLDIETAFADIFSIDSPPAVVVINPHLKVRFCKQGSDSQPTTPHIRKLLDAISAGEERFKIIPAAKMPKFVDRKVEKKDEL